MCHFHSQHLGQLFLAKIHITDQLQQQTPLQPNFNPNQSPPPTFAPGLLPTTPHLQNQISPRVLWPHSLNRAFYNLPPYKEYPYKIFPVIHLYHKIQLKQRCFKYPQPR